MDYREKAEQLAIFFKNAQKNLPSDLMHGESGVLANLLIHKNGMLSGELSALLELSSGRTSTAIKSLEKKGYVVRNSDKEDARQVRVSLTEEGQKYANMKFEEVMDCTIKILEKLGPNDADEFTRIMGRISKF